MKLSWIILIVFLLTGCTNISHVPKPVLSYVPPSKNEAEQITIATRFHDKKQYDKAISQYQTLLQANPNNATVLYEIALSYYAKNDFRKSLDYLKSAARYSSPFLPNVYLLIAQNYKNINQPDQAVLVYKYASKLFESHTELHYQLGATYLSINEPGKAAEAFKKCIAIEPTHRNSYFQLGAAYYFHDYKTPAFLSLMTFLLFEPNSKRSSIALSLIDDIFKSGVEINKKTNEISLSTNIAPKLDEGDFRLLDIAMSARRIELLLNKKKISEINIKEEQLSSYLLALSQLKLDNAEKYFITQQLFPFYKTLFRKKMTDILFFYTHQSLDNRAIKQWQRRNPNKFREFESYLKKYNW